MPKLSFPATMDHIGSMLDFIVTGARENGFERKVVNQIRLVSEEILANIINYAYPETTGAIDIDYDFDEMKGLSIRIVDQGIPFDPLAAPEPDLEAPIEDRTIGGLGILLIRQIMDEVAYSRTDNTNVLRVVKYRV